MYASWVAAGVILSPRATALYTEGEVLCDENWNAIKHHTIGDGHSNETRGKLVVGHGLG